LTNISYKLLCLETGLLQPLESPFIQFGKLATNSYLKSIWEFAHAYDIQIRGPPNPAYCLTSNNTLIMEEMAQWLDDSDIKGFNMYRIYLQVLWMSDISTADGKYINWYAIKGKLISTWTLQWNWPKQGTPPNSAWTSWQKGLQLLGNRNRNGTIKCFRPVGSWRSTSGCGWLFDPSSNRLQNQHTGQIWLRKTGRPTRAATIQFFWWQGTDVSF
jgi:hypothetical protein